MSVKLMSAIFETEFIDMTDGRGNITKASTAKLVLLALADHANDEGESAYPSIPTLARKTALSEQTIRNTFDCLKFNGIIFLKGTSKFRTNEYAINTHSFPVMENKPSTRLTLKPLEGQTDGWGGSNGSLLTLNPLDPNHQLTTKEPSSGGLSEDEISQANAMVDAIIENGKKAKYSNRDKIPEPYLELADTYVELTGQEPRKSVLHEWLMELSEWQAAGISSANIREAYKHANRDGGFLVTGPRALTKTAIALKSKTNGRERSMTTLERIEQQIARSHG